MEITPYRGGGPSRATQGAIVGAGYASRMISGQLSRDYEVIGGALKRGAEYLAESFLTPPETKRMRGANFGGTPNESIPVPMEEECPVEEGGTGRRYRRYRKMPYYLW